jgi:hypothetical protein
MHETIRNTVTRLHAALTEISHDLANLPAHPDVTTGAHGETVGYGRAAWSLVMDALTHLETMVALETPKPEAQ